MLWIMTNGLLLVESHTMKHILNLYTAIEIMTGPKKCVRVSRTETRTSYFGRGNMQIASEELADGSHPNNNDSLLQLLKILHVVT